MHAHTHTRAHTHTTHTHARIYTHAHTYTHTHTHTHTRTYTHMRAHRLPGQKTISRKSLDSLIFRLITNSTFRQLHFYLHLQNIKLAKYSLAQYVIENFDKLPTIHKSISYRYKNFQFKKGNRDQKDISY